MGEVTGRENAATGVADLEAPDWVKLWQADDYIQSREVHGIFEAYVEQCEAFEAIDICTQNTCSSTVYHELIQPVIEAQRDLLCVNVDDEVCELEGSRHCSEVCGDSTMSRCLPRAISNDAHANLFCGCEGWE